MKKIILTLFLLSSFALGASIEECYKLYPYEADSLFMAALSAISNDPNYELAEIQTKNGYILFLADSKYYLLTLTKRYKNQTEIKILPQNSDYSNITAVTSNVFNLINQEVLKPMELVK